MVTRTRAHLLPVLAIVSAMSLHAADARAERVDIDDPAVLGPVVYSQVIDQDPGFAGRAYIRTEVRRAGGLYSYIYAVQSDAYSPLEFSQRMVSFSFTGGPLRETWGAIYNNTSYWHPQQTGVGSTYPIVSVTPLRDGFWAVPEIPWREGEESRNKFAVIYVRTPLPPSFDGSLMYKGTGSDCNGATGECFSFELNRSFDGVLAPVPEPASIVLFGLGLASLAVRRRTTRQ